MSRHALSRAFQRHGFALNEVQQRQLVERARRKPALKTYEDGRAFYRVDYRGRRLGLIVAASGALVTVLGENMQPR